MSELPGAVVASLGDLGWAAELQDTAIDGEHHYLLERGGDASDEQPAFPIVLVIHETAEIVSMYSVAPFDVPEDQRLAAVVYLTMANHGLLLGNFELDLTDGEVRYKTSTRTGALDDLTGELREQLSFNLGAFSTYLPGLAEVASGELDPLDAITAIEAPDTEPGDD